MWMRGKPCFWAECSETIRLDGVTYYTFGVPQGGSSPWIPSPGLDWHTSSPPPAPQRPAHHVGYTQKEWVQSIDKRHFLSLSAPINYPSPNPGFLCSPSVCRATIWPLVHPFLRTEWGIHHTGHQLVQFCQPVEPQGLLCHRATQSAHVSMTYHVISALTYDPP